MPAVPPHWENPSVDFPSQIEPLLGLLLASFGRTEKKLNDLLTITGGTGMTLVSAYSSLVNTDESVAELFAFYEALLPIRDLFVHGEVSLTEYDVRLSRRATSQADANRRGAQVDSPEFKKAVADARDFYLRAEKNATSEAMRKYFKKARDNAASIGLVVCHLPLGALKAYVASWYALSHRLSVFGDSSEGRFFVAGVRMGLYSG